MILRKIKKMTLSDYFHLIKVIFSYFPGKILKMFYKNIWLISEREYDAHDNGYWLFKYVRENYPHKKVYYAINFDSSDYLKLATLDNIIRFGSYKHHIYTWACNKFISAHIGNGFPNGHICFNLLIWNFYKFKNVFLQHGITHNMPEYLLEENNNINLICCAAFEEYKFMIDKLGYKENIVKLVGLCRFDNLFDISSNKEKLVLIMPTWRKWLEYSYDNLDEIFIRFTNSNFYKNYIKILLDERIQRCLKKKEIDVIFYLHSDFQIYSEIFDVSGVKIAKHGEYDIQELLKKSNYLVTDYSSVAFDFAYMGKPMCYFQFDYEDYRKHHYAEGYFSYNRDGFGPVFKKPKEVVDDIINVIQDKFANKEQYRARERKFFFYNDGNNCKRTYENIELL